MDGSFTGINIDKVISDITKVDESYNTVINNFCNDFYDLFSSLAVHWASPVAYGFTCRFHDMFLDILKKYNTEFLFRMHGVCDAAKDLCRVNEMDIPSVLYKYDEYTRSFDNYIPGDFSNIPLCGETLNGLTGMAKDSVRFARDLFSSQLEKRLYYVHIPSSVGFYDVNGNLNSQFNLNMKNFYDDLSNAIKLFLFELNNCIDTEIENIRLASNSAETSMGSYSANT